jgi:hypothetical protein
MPSLVSQAVPSPVSVSPCSQSSSPRSVMALVIATPRARLPVRKPLGARPRPRPRTRRSLLPLPGAHQLRALAVYDVRRIYRARNGDPQAKGDTWHSVIQLTTGDRRSEQRALAAACRATVRPDSNGIRKAVLSKGYPGSRSGSWSQARLRCLTKSAPASPRCGARCTPPPASTWPIRAGSTSNSMSTPAGPRGPGIVMLFSTG